MKLQKLSTKLLKYMVNDYHKTGNTIFLFDDLHSVFNEVKREHLDMALWNLKRKKFTSVSPGDNVAYESTLTTLGIEAGEANTFFKKFLLLVKVIKALLC